MKLDISTILPGNQRLFQTLLSCEQTQKQKIPIANNAKKNITKRKKNLLTI